MIPVIIYAPNFYKTKPIWSMQKLVLLIALLLIPLPLTGTEENKSLRIDFGAYGVMLSETPYGLTLDINRGADRVVAINNISFVNVELPGIWEKESTADRFHDVREREDGFSFGISEKNTVNVTLVGDGVWFNVSSSDVVKTSYSGADLWYGGGSLLNQSYPLENVEINPLSDVISQALPDFLRPIMPAVDGVLALLYGMISPLAMHLSPVPLAFMGLENDLMMTRPFGYNFQTPFWLSKNFGVFLNTTDPVEYSIHDGVLNLGVRDYSAKIILGESPAEIFDSYVDMVGKPSKVLPLSVLEAPIWTIGSQYASDFDQDKVLEYARKIAKSGLEHSTLTIDVGWQKEHGDTDFDHSRFPDPKAMVDELHSLGFKVILWTVPYVSSTSDNYKEGFEKGYYIKDPLTSLPVHIPWSYVAQIALDAMHLKLYSVARGLSKPLCSAIIDLSNPDAFEWYVGNLRFLVEEYGIDGFKMDQGEGAFLPMKGSTFGNVSVNEYTDLCTEAGKSFDYYEIRSGWFSQSHGGWAREYDKFATWSEENGIKSVVPEALTLSILGYPYVLPDVVGGGQFFDDGYDEELYIRWAELEAFMPIMQFSDNFFVQSERAKELSLHYMKVHRDLYPYLSELANESKVSGVPMVRPLFMHYNEEECYTIKDEYLLGSNMLVAPVLEKGSRERKVFLPEGMWKDYWSDAVYEGGSWIDIEAPLELIPVFVAVN
jgi:hypothetical protein